MVNVSPLARSTAEPWSQYAIKGSAGDVGVSLYKITYRNCAMAPPLAVNTTLVPETVTVPPDRVAMLVTEEPPAVYPFPAAISLASPSTVLLPTVGAVLLSATFMTSAPVPPEPNRSCTLFMRCSTNTSYFVYVAIGFL